jgi:dCTP deaminase
MTLKSDKWITEQSILRDMIVPFVDKHTSTINVNNVKLNVPSFGLSSYGYDIRLGSKFKFYKGNTISELYYGIKDNLYEDIIPKSKYDYIDIANFKDTSGVFETPDVDWIELPANSFCLGCSIERIKVPKKTSVICMGKSTVARAGIIVTVTPLETMWEGYVTLEITNTLNTPVRIYPGMGITQLQFFESDEVCNVSYADRNGKYQNQPAVPVIPL